ncbi:MAG: hypothetical protein N7Q72_01500 [Spiroplasma sp. Tabriz.8]|nr:hypothetical protein [Spiroplasma sp. Tabriz.8]
MQKGLKAVKINYKYLINFYISIYIYIYIYINYYSFLLILF